MSYLQTARPQVVDETVDGEVVIVHLDKGLYFSATGVAACVWNLLMDGNDIDAAVDWVTRTYADVESARGDTVAFIGEITTYALVREVESVSTETDPTGEPTGVAAPPTYVAPTLEVFSDMAELLLLDPIHDVEEEQGWPKTGG